MLASPALKKLPLSPEQRQDMPHTTPIKPLELPEHVPLITPVEIKPPTSGILRRSTSSPGPCWDLVPGHEPSVQGAHMKQGLYRFNPLKAAREDALGHPTWRILNSWRTRNSGLPPRPPAQAGVYIKD